MGFQHHRQKQMAQPHFLSKQIASTNGSTQPSYKHITYILAIRPVSVSTQSLSFPLITSSEPTSLPRLPVNYMLNHMKWLFLRSKIVEWYMLTKSILFPSWACRRTTSQVPLWLSRATTKFWTERLYEISWP